MIQILVERRKIEIFCEVPRILASTGNIGKFNLIKSLLAHLRTGISPLWKDFQFHGKTRAEDTSHP